MARVLHRGELIAASERMSRYTHMPEPVTVADWSNSGNLGLPIRKCPGYVPRTKVSWQFMVAQPHDQIIDLCDRICCRGCDDIAPGTETSAYQVEP